MFGSNQTELRTIAAVTDTSMDVVCPMCHEKDLKIDHEAQMVACKCSWRFPFSYLKLWTATYDPNNIQLEPVSTTAFGLKKGETCSFVDPCILKEVVHVPGHYQGGSRGVSVPVGHMPWGGNVRVHVGAFSGRYVPGPDVLTEVDTGHVYLTNQRAIFVGKAKAVELPYTKLIMVQPYADGVHLQVSGRKGVEVLQPGRLPYFVDVMNHLRGMVS
jgi:hypothetical protein